MPHHTTMAGSAASRTLEIELPRVAFGTAWPDIARMMFDDRPDEIGPAIGSTPVVGVDVTWQPDSMATTSFALR